MSPLLFPEVYIRLLHFYLNFYRSLAIFLLFLQVPTKFLQVPPNLSTGPHSIPLFRLIPMISLPFLEVPTRLQIHIQLYFLSGPFDFYRSRTKFLQVPLFFSRGPPSVALFRLVPMSPLPFVQVSIRLVHFYLNIYRSLAIFRGLLQVPTEFLQVPLNFSTGPHSIPLFRLIPMISLP